MTKILGKTVKDTKNLLMTFILILCLSFTFQGTRNLYIDQNEVEKGNDVTRLHLSDSGIYLWHRIWDNGTYQVGYGIAMDSSNNIYVTGHVRLGGPILNNDMVLVKYNSSGDQQWNRTWGTTSHEVGRGVAIDSLENIYVTGSTGSDEFLIKFNSSGDQQWISKFGSSSANAYGITIDSIDNIYIGGYGYGGLFLRKYNSSGDQQWKQSVGGNGDYGFGVAIDSLDNAYIVGTTSSFGAGETDVILAKYNNSGAQQWNRTWGGSSTEWGYKVAVDSLDNSYIVGNGEVGGFLLKYNSSGELEWNREGNQWVSSNRGVMTVDSLDNVYIAAKSIKTPSEDLDMILLKYNSIGETIWNCTWGGSDDDSGIGVVVDSLHNVYLLGDYNHASAQGDIALVKFYQAPEIVINYPNQDDLYGNNAPNFNMTIFEDNLNDSWYVLGSGSTKISLLDGMYSIEKINDMYIINGTIDQTEWDKLGSGTILLKFYANDTFGKQNSIEVQVIKDISNPGITINNPSRNETFGEHPPYYDIIIAEPHLAWAGYTIDDGLNNYTMSGTNQFIGTINQTVWDAAPYGNITIRFFARDLLRNTGSSEVIVAKVEEVDGGEEPEDEGQVITGYSLLIFISMLGLITVIYSKKKFLS